MIASRILYTARPLSRSLRPFLSSSSCSSPFRRSFALDSKSTASASSPSRTGQSPAGGANNQQVGSSSGINASQQPQKPTTAHSTGAAAGANTGDRPATSTPMSGSGTGHDQSQSMDSYARQADKSSKDAGKASHDLKAKTGTPASGNATSGDETMTSGTVKSGHSSSSSSSHSSSSRGASGGSTGAGGQGGSSPAGKADSNLGSGGAIGSHGSSTAGGGSHRTNTGDGSAAGKGLAPGSGVASMADKAKERLNELTGDVELPAASSYTVIGAALLAVPLIMWLDPDARFLAKEAKEQDRRTYEKYHGVH